MNSLVVSQQFKLAAIDLDGTLLGPDREISPENFRAVQQLQQSGLHVVLASGRHYLNIHRYAAALSGIEWIVSVQGGESADLTRANVLNRDFLPQTMPRQILELGDALGFTSLIYNVDGILTAADWNSDLQLYSDIAGRQPLQSPAQSVLDQPAFKMIWMGPPEAIEKACTDITLSRDIQMVRTQERMLEIMPTAVTKASGLQRIATRLGIDPAETMVFGDGDNDVPMFQWAGASFAMAHGWPAALQSATHITAAGPHESAFARGVDHAFQSGLLS